MRNGVPILTRVRNVLSKNEPYGVQEEEGKPGGPVIAICLLVSGLLWFAFSMQETYPLVLNLPTDVVNVPPDRVLTSQPPRNVRVQVVGEGVSLFQLYYNRPEIKIDAALREVDFQATDLTLPKDVRIESVTPRTFIPSLEPKATRIVPVRVRSDIDIPESYEFLQPPTVFPDSVSVTAGESVIQSLTYWPTERFEESSLRDSLNVKLALADTLTGIASAAIDEVTMTAVAREFTGGQVNVEVMVRGAPSDNKLVTLDPSTITIRYRVLLSQFNAAARSSGFGATVSYDEIRSDTTGSVRPRLILPSNLELRDVDYFPETLRYYNYLSDE